MIKNSRIKALELELMIEKLKDQKVDAEEFLATVDRKIEKLETIKSGMTSELLSSKEYTEMMRDFLFSEVLEDNELKDSLKELFEVLDSFKI